MQQLKITPRRAWTSFRPALSRIQEPVPSVFLHHDVFRSLSPKATEAEEKEALRQLENFHRTSREMTCLAYNFWVCPSGRVYEGRGWGRVGGHTFNFNSSSIAICFNGNFEIQKPTKAALDSARALIALGKVKGHIKPDAKIRGHRDVGAAGGGTACPGQNLYQKLAYIKSHDRHPHATTHPHRIDGAHHHSHRHPHRKGLINGTPHHHR